MRLQRQPAYVCNYSAPSEWQSSNWLMGDVGVNGLCLIACRALGGDHPVSINEVRCLLSVFLRGESVSERFEPSLVDATECLRGRFIAHTGGRELPRPLDAGAPASVHVPNSKRR